MSFGIVNVPGAEGSTVHQGTGITGTSTTDAAFPGSGITLARTNDLYLNTTTGNVYKCTLGGAAAVAKWVYTGCLMGPQGQAGANGAAAGFGNVAATVDNRTGTPSVSVDTGGPDTAKEFIFRFENLKGATGAAAGFGTVNATVDSNVGTPSVTVTTSGNDTAKNFVFAFKNLKGETGATGAKGATGATGPRGATGATGKSAYEAAKSAGYTGTETNFNAALLELKDGPFLPAAGGTITGNLRLKGTGNFGNIINFGDSDYVHISEPADDCLEIKAKKVNFVLSDTSTARFTINGSSPFTGGSADIPYLKGSGTAYANTANYAVALGNRSNAGGYGSTALGGYATASGVSSTALGYYATASGSESTALGHYAATSNANSIQLGNSSYLSRITAKVGITVTSGERDKTDVTEIANGATEFLKKVKAVTFVYNQRELYRPKEPEKDENGEPIIEDGIDYLTKADHENLAKYGFCRYDEVAHKAGNLKGTRRRAGVLAQQVQKAMEEVYGSSSYANLVDDNLFDFEDVPEGIESTLALNYDGFIPFLIKAFQELENRVTTLEKGANHA